MTETPIDRDALATALAERARRDTGGAPGPEPEELLDYLAGRLPPEAEERVRRQLVADPEAARALLDLAELEAAREDAGEAASSEVPPPVDLAAHAGWRDLQRRLRPVAEPEGARAEVAPAGPRRRRWLISALATAAAALLVVAGGLGFRVARLEHELHRPIGNLATLELIGDVRAEPRRLELDPGQPLRVVLEPSSSEDCDVYEAVLTGAAHVTLPGLHPDELGLVSFVLWPDRGNYTVQLLGCEPRRVVDEYPFQIGWRTAASTGGDGR